MVYFRDFGWVKVLTWSKKVHEIVELYKKKSNATLERFLTHCAITNFEWLTRCLNTSIIKHIYINQKCYYSRHTFFYEVPLGWNFICINKHYLWHHSSSVFAWSTLSLGTDTIRSKSNEIERKNVANEKPNHQMQNNI